MDSSKHFLRGVIAGMLLLAAVLIATSLSPKQINLKWQEDCVDRGYAEWVVENHEVKFVWKQSK
jgi:hypothetical protein